MKIIDKSNVFYFIFDFVGKVFGLSIHEDLPFQTIEKHGVDKKNDKLLNLEEKRHDKLFERILLMCVL